MQTESFINPAKAGLTTRPGLRVPLIHSFALSLISTMTTIRTVTACLEAWAPLAYQESYDNAGLIVGDPSTPVTGVLVTLDATEAVIDEAIARGCNLVVAHHPIVFKGLKKFNGRTYVERTVIKAIKNDVAIYASHTNLDNVTGGVNFKIAQKLSLRDTRILSPKAQTLTKLSVYIPVGDTEALLQALYAAGAGQIGNYEHCSFRVEGTGTFKPLDGANPVIGQVGTDEAVREHKVEVIFPSHLEGAIVSAMKKAHPYEEVAHDLYPVLNVNGEVGSGAIGELPEAMSGPDFLAYLKQQMQVTVIRHTALPAKPIRRVAVCGGAGGFLLPNAIRAGADVLVTADYKYHEFFDADQQIMICDIGHYESEVFTKELIQHYLSKHFTNFAVILSETVTNPIQYYF